MIRLRFRLSDIYWVALNKGYQTFDSAITTYNDYQLDRNHSALNMYRKYISENKHKQFPIISICQRDTLMNVCFCVYKSFIVNRFMK